jgi:uncharacterized protein
MSEDKRAIKIIEQTIKVINKALGPSRIFLFGSRAKGTNDGCADFDIAVEGKRPNIEVERKISEEVEKISGLYKVDIVYTENVDADFKDIIYKTGKVIHERRA